MAISAGARQPVGLHELLVRVAEAGLGLQRADGSFPPGCNGPWRHTVTPARNSGHWLITMARAAALTGEVRFRRSAERALAYLLSPELRPGGYTFLHRLEPGPAGANSLIGQAWTLQALIAGFELTGDDALLATAQEVFSLHPFHERLGLWRIRQVDGRERGLAATLNQQIWFGAIARDLGRLGFRQAASRAETFRRRLPAYLRLDGEGFFRHSIFTLTVGLAQPRRILGELGDRSWRRARQSELSVGYHAFCLAGLARLLDRGGQPALKSPAAEICQALETARVAARAFEANRFAYGYNPVGFEMALASEWADQGLPAEARDWAQRQLDLCFDPGRSLMIRRSGDAATLAARFCEAVDLPDYPVFLPRDRRDSEGRS